MKSKGWVIDSFYFPYNQQNYIVLVKLLEKGEKVPDYALVKIEFLKESDFSDSLTMYANSVKLFTDAKTLRTYFDIQYQENLGSILSQFNHTLAKYIPTAVTDKKNENQIEAMCRSLSNSDSKDPRKKYCFSVRRNPFKDNGEREQRSDFNDNKTRLYRPSLYKRLGSDSTISFRYSKDPTDEKTDECIIINWTKNKENE